MAKGESMWWAVQISLMTENYNSGKGRRGNISLLRYTKFLTGQITGLKIYSRVPPIGGRVFIFFGEKVYMYRPEEILPAETDDERKN